MMQRILWVILISTAITFMGCESQEQPETKTAPHQVVKPEKQLKVEEEVKPAIAAAKEVAEKAEEKVEQVAKEAGEIVEKSSNAVAVAVNEAMPEAKEQMETSVATVKDNVAEKADAINTVAAPEVITLEASYGNVAFPHAMHSGNFECSTCHEGTPAAFDITKEVAHQLCKGCHKDGGAGPTACRDCHKK